LRPATMTCRGTCITKCVATAPPPPPTTPAMTRRAPARSTVVADFHSRSRNRGPPL
jgi:hypothetical protein